MQHFPPFNPDAARFPQPVPWAPWQLPEELIAGAQKLGHAADRVAVFVDNATFVFWHGYALGFLTGLCAAACLLLFLEMRRKPK